MAVESQHINFNLLFIAVATAGQVSSHFSWNTALAGFSLLFCFPKGHHFDHLDWMWCFLPKKNNDDFTYLLSNYFHSSLPSIQVQTTQHDKQRSLLSSLWCILSGEFEQLINHPPSSEIAESPSIIVSGACTPRLHEFDHK